MYLQAKAWGNPPSDIIDLRMGTFEAYCFNEAVLYFGGSVQAKLEKVEGKTSEQIEQKQSRLLERLLYPSKEVSSTQFADPGVKWGHAEGN